MAGVVDNYGLVKVILAFGIFQLLLVLLLPLIDVHQTRRVLGDGTSAST